MKNNVAFRLFLGPIIYCILSLASCEKDLPTNRDFDPLVSEEANIEINISEIGGDNLKLISSRDDDSPLYNATFSTIVSRDYVQLLFVKDSKDELRALTLSLPDRSNTEVLQISNYSTALSLVFVSPGITTTNPGDALKTVDNIISLSSFDTFQNYLKSNLKSKSLNSIVLETTYNTLLSGCISEYFDAFSIKSSEITKSDLYWINDVALDEVNPPIKYELHNRALRCVNLIQRDLDQDEEEIDVRPILEGVGGGPTFSYGSLITLGFFWKHTTAQFDYEPVINTSQSELWVAGMGWRKASVVAPQSVKDLGRAEVETTLNYIIFPTLELMWGVGGLLDIPTDDMRVFVATIKLLLKDAPNALDESDETTAGIGLIDFTMSVVKVISMVANNVLPESIETLVANAGVQTLPEIAGDFFKWGSVILAGGNVGGLIANLAVVEKYTKYTLLAYNQPPMFPALREPANNATNLSIPVTLQWSASTLAETYTIQVSQDQYFSVIDFQYDAVTGTGFQLNDLEMGTTYYWRMNAKNDYGTSPWSEVWNFTTMADNNIIFNPNVSYGSFTDPRDNNVYKTLQLGNQIWMAENMRYLSQVNPPSNKMGNWVYGYIGTDVNEAKATENYKKYGVLYNWTQATSACPTGWHLPSENDWMELENFLIANGNNFDGTIINDKLGKSLASSYDWVLSTVEGSVGNTDYSDKRNLTGFTGLPAGYRGKDGKFYNLGYRTSWWSSTFQISYIVNGERVTYYYYRSLRNDQSDLPGGGNSGMDIEVGASIRCIKN